MKTAAVLPAGGIGDALLMMIASHQLHLRGYEVTTFHPVFPELKVWFPGQNFSDTPTPSLLSSFDLIVIENDNSPNLSHLLAAYRSKIAVFYPTYSPKKHPPLEALDSIFDPNLPMATNIGAAIGKILQQYPFSKENGITPPNHLVHRKFPRRVIIHPTSREKNKNWSAQKFITVAKRLKQKGFFPCFCVGPEEVSHWSSLKIEGLTLIDSPNLGKFAEFVYESGIVIGNDSFAGHLASNLNIPSLIIANDEKRIRLWRPDWHIGVVICPPKWLPNKKFFRVKQRYWQHFLSPKKVVTELTQLVLKEYSR